MTDDKNGDNGLNRPAELAHRNIDFGLRSDEELMLLVQEGRNQAFDVLVGRYKNRLFTYLCRLLGNRGEAEAVVQATGIGAMVLVDDRWGRKLAQQYSLEFHGTLWLLERLHELGL